MKRLLFLPIILCIVLLSDCKEEKEEPLYFETSAPAAYTFQAAVDSATFTISGNAAWAVKVEENSDWCSVTPASGKGDATLTVRVAANAVYLQERTVAFVVTAGDYSKPVTITQAAPPCPAFSVGAIAVTGQTIAIGGTPATITSAKPATGGDGKIAYQWYKNGNAIRGATAATYTPPKEDAEAVAVNTYTRRAKDSLCNATLTPSTGSWVLTVTCPSFSPGAIAATGQALTIGGTPATIGSVQNATGAGTVLYQWYKNGNAISGATNATYTPPYTDAVAVGSITYTRCAKDNVCNTTLTLSTGSWVLTVTCPSFSSGIIATAGQVLTVGGTPAAINSVQNATGIGVISYQWYKNSNAISGATSASYTPPLADALVAGSITYTRRAKDNTCNTTFTLSTGTWELTVSCPSFNSGAIATTGQTVMVGGVPVTIENLANASSENGVISYQWYKNGNAINGATGITYTPPTTDALEATSITYTRRAKDNVCNTTFTSSAGSWVLTVTCPSFNAGAIAIDGQSIAVGGVPSTINSVQNANSAGSTSYQWYKNGNTISGATSATYTPPLTDASVMGVNTYTRRAKDNVCNTTLTDSEGSWVLNVTCAFNSGAIATAGQNVFLFGTPTMINSVQNATTTDTGTISYQWYKENIAIVGATEAYYTPPISDASVIGVTTYTRRAKDNVCNKILTDSEGSWVLNVTCAFNPGAIATAGQEISVEETPTTIMSVTGATSDIGTISYQWYKNGVAISGATGASYTPPASDAATAGVTTYTRHAKDNVCNTTFTPSSGSWVLTVNCPAFNAGSIATDEQIICIGNSVNTIGSNMDASGGNGHITYEWRWNGSPIASTNSVTYAPTAYNTTVGTHTFTRWVRDGSCNTSWTQSAGSWTLTVIGYNLQLTLTTDNSQQVVEKGMPITPIKYTAKHVKTVAITGLPDGISYNLINDTLTISGSSTASGDYSFQVIPTGPDECFCFTYSGYIVIYPEGINRLGCVVSDLALGTVGFVSNETYVIGNQIWSAPVIATYCDKTTYNSIYDEEVDCRNSTDIFSGHLFSWCMVGNYADKLCPPPWRVPTKDDFCTLDKNLRDVNTCEYWTGSRFSSFVSSYEVTWGSIYGGYVIQGNFGSAGSGAYYWSISSTFDATHTAKWGPYSLYIQGGYSGIYQPTHRGNPQSHDYPRSSGFQVRCVQDN